MSVNEAYDYRVARIEFDMWRSREADDVTGRPEACDWTSWLEGWMAAEKQPTPASNEPTPEQIARWKSYTEGVV